MSLRQKPEVELFIKASLIDGVRNGACIFCHKWFMVLYQKSKVNELALTVTTVNMKQYPKEIKELTHSQPPILLHDDFAMPEERIFDHLREYFSDPLVFALNNTVKKKIENVYSKFNHYLAATTEEGEQRAEKNLVAELSNIDKFLATMKTKFLCGDHISLYDCELMPKLQHIRIAGKAYKHFDIPHTLHFLCAYIDNFYHLDLFIETCPADQDIIANYRGKVINSSLSVPNSRKQEALEEPTFSLTIPVVIPPSSAKAYSHRSSSSSSISSSSLSSTKNTQNDLWGKNGGAIGGGFKVNSVKNRNNNKNNTNEDSISSHNSNSH